MDRFLFFKDCPSLGPNAYSTKVVTLKVTGPAATVAGVGSQPPSVSLMSMTGAPATWLRKPIVSWTG